MMLLLSAREGCFVQPVNVQLFLCCFACAIKGVAICECQGGKSVQGLLPCWQGVQSCAPFAPLHASLSQALEAGYRHIDTARLYFNEAMIGQEIKEWIAADPANRYWDGSCCADESSLKPQELAGRQLRQE
eukprot:1138230-Pelagomonas_calceolata.AAC.1